MWRAYNNNNVWGSIELTLKSLNYLVTVLKCIKAVGCISLSHSCSRTHQQLFLALSPSLSRTFTFPSKSSTKLYSQLFASTSRYCFQSMVGSSSTYLPTYFASQTEVSIKKDSAILCFFKYLPKTFLCRVVVSSCSDSTLDQELSYFSVFFFLVSRFLLLSPSWDSTLLCSTPTKYNFRWSHLLLKLLRVENVFLFCFIDKSGQMC